MRITVLNGSPSPSLLDGYLADLRAELTARGAEVTQIDLRQLDMRHCIGCFGCWVKTPGLCVVEDGSQHFQRAVIQSDFTLWAAPLRMGFPSALLKQALDKSIPLVHPYFVVDRGEAHHRPRYPHYPRLGLLLEPEADTDAQDLRIVSDLLGRTAVNLKSNLEFSWTIASGVAGLASRILAASHAAKASVPSVAPTSGQRIAPPTRLTLFNGSPRGRKGNTPILLDRFARGFASVPGRTFEMVHLNRLQEREAHVRAFAEAEAVWLGLPLYTDAMPGIVKEFIEALAPLASRPGNPPIGFLVQSGFPEALHSRHLERYLQKLASRLKAPYLGTIVKGGGEGVRMMPERSNARLFDALERLGRSLALEGELDAALLKTVAGVERYPALLGPVFSAFVRLPIASWYWDTQLKENGAYEERFAQPLLDPEPDR